MIPRIIPTLNKDLVPAGTPFRRLDRKQLGLTEKRYDQLLIQHVDALTDALKAAELLPDNATLRHLRSAGKLGQVNRMDVLFGEFVDEELRRLVVVEDKLLKSPQARREVLTQVIGYADDLRRDFPEAEDLLDQLDHDAQALLTDQTSEIERIIRNGDLLLLVCGDDVHPELIDFVRRLTGETRRMNVLDLYEIAMVSLPIYSDGERWLLVPHVVGSIVRGERDLTIEVRVQNANGEPVVATASRATTTKEARSASEADFFAAKWPAQEQAVQAFRRAFSVLQQEGGRVLRYRTTSAGKPEIWVEAPGTEAFKLFRARAKRPGVVAEFLKLRPAPPADVVPALGELRQVFVSIPGATELPDGIRMDVPPDEFLAALDRLTPVVAKLVRSLQDAARATIDSRT